METVARERREDHVREIVADLNARILDSRRRQVDGPRIFLRTFDVEEVVRRWRELRS
jgi:hypothetical protein